MEIIIAVAILAVAILQLFGKPFKIEITHHSKVDDGIISLEEEPKGNSEEVPKEIAQVFQEMIGVMNDE